MGMKSAYKHFMKALTSEYFDHSSFPFFFLFSLKIRKEKCCSCPFANFPRDRQSSLKDPPPCVSADMIRPKQYP